MNKKIGLKNLIIVVFFVTLLVAFANFYNPKTVINEEVNIAQETHKSLISNCGLSVQNLFGGDIVEKNFTIDVILANDMGDLSACRWSAFEAQVGVVYVKDIDGNDIAKPTPMTTTQEWMTSEPVMYNAEINVDPDYIGTAFITINEENASDNQISKTIDFAVTVK